MSNLIKNLAVLLVLFAVGFSLHFQYKVEWPEVRGLEVGAAKATILNDDSSAHVVIIPSGYPTTRDYRRNRVRVFVDSDGIVE
jgi:hypothetical protein